MMLSARQALEKRLIAYLCACGGHTVNRIDRDTHKPLPIAVSFPSGVVVVPDDLIGLMENEMVSS